MRYANIGSLEGEGWAVTLDGTKRFHGSEWLQRFNVRIADRSHLIMKTLTVCV